MSDITPPTPEETQAAKRYTVMNLVRLGAIVAVLAGIAGAQSTMGIPYILSIALAGAGLVSFFFVPPLLARRWKAHNREQS